MTWVMSDIHGCLSEFKELVGELNLTEDDTLYILGDLINHGPDSWGCVEYARSLPNTVILRGNHEQMILEERWLWEQNGGKKAIQEFDRLPPEKQSEIKDWVESLPKWKVIKVMGKNYILVHAGLDVSKRQKGERLSSLMECPIRQTGQYGEDHKLWIREEFLLAPALKNYKVIFGHTPTKTIPTWRKSEIWFGAPKFISKETALYRGDKIGVDCGCVHGGSLAAYCIETTEEVYVDSKSSSRVKKGDVVNE